MLDIVVNKRALKEKEVALTGRLASMTHEEARELVHASGGRFVASPTRTTDILVIGQEGWPLQSDGHLTRQLEKAHSLQQGGYDVQIIPEETFLQDIGLEEGCVDIHRLYTNAQLSKILNIPRDRLRLWIRVGLIRPAKVLHRLSYFDFREVANVKALSDLVSSGVTLDRIRKSLKQLRTWMPEIGQPLACFSSMKEHGTLVLRLNNGQLVEPNGQLLFDFLAAKESAVAKSFSQVQTEPQTADDWFRAALRYEDLGQLKEASEAYQQALLSAGPQVEFCFNLANVFYSLGEKEKAVERFRQAVELDPAFVEAWNNLGNALADLGDAEAALRAYRRALDVEPAYADAHYNLAELLDQIGDTEASRAHWQAYLRLDPHSSWAQHVRERLR